MRSTEFAALRMLGQMVRPVRSHSQGPFGVAMPSIAQKPRQMAKAAAFSCSVTCAPERCRATPVQGSVRPIAADYRTSAAAQIS